MIIARLESLIANQGMEDAVTRAKSYLLAGAEGIMIHSKSKRADEVYEFLQRYDELCQQLGFMQWDLLFIPGNYIPYRPSELRILVLSIYPIFKDF